MLYTDLQKTGRLIFSYDKHGQGPYQDAYAGTVEYWAVGNDIYYHETNDNKLSYTGKPANTEYLGVVADPDALPAAFERASCYAEIYGDIMDGRIK